MLELRRVLWAAAAVVCSTQEAQAQRADENAVTAASDAFGTRVGDESVGLYDPFSARGFSPAQAGNVRIEGLYFDQQAQPNSRVLRGSTVRVGISAQSYSFPAPTGIADLQLRLPGDKFITSALVTYGPFDTYVAEVDTQAPLISEKLNVGLGAGLVRYDNDSASKNFEWSVGALVRLRPTDNSEFTGFGSWLEDCRYRQQPSVFPGGPYEPPRFERRKFFGQSWTRNGCSQRNAGLLGRIALPQNWVLRVGVFRSENINHHTFGDFLRAVQPDGSAQHTILAQPRQSSASYSGEIRAAKIITEGPRRHTVSLAMRGRDVERAYGGSDLHSFGTGTVGVRTALPEPIFVFGPLTRDHTRQGIFGVAYDGLWAGTGALGLGVQKTFYHRDILQPGLPEATSRAQPMLYNASANFIPLKSLAIYTSYARGLEESGIAPNSAVNRGEAMPASITEQIDAGIRYAVTPSFNVIAGIFQVEKPYFNLGATNVFGALGTVRHRGIEFSMTGEVAEGLTIVAGMILLQPRVSGDPVDRGVIGAIPVGSQPRSAALTIQYQPASWKGFGLNGRLSNSSGQMTRTDNSFKTSNFMQLNLGARYNFKVFNMPISWRAQVQNVTNAYGWNVGASGSFFPKTPRRYSMTLTADLQP